MKYKYQLVLLGSPKGHQKQIEKLFLDTIKKLKLKKEAFIIIGQNDFSTSFKKNQPAFCIYFSEPNPDSQTSSYLDILIDDAAPILPLYFKSFTAEIPAILGNYNGVELNNFSLNKIVNLALESFGKLRQSRKVFISYKREDSSSVAIQLYEALEANNFDVFLDTYSIKGAEPFQEELWHRMTDCDVIVMLNTKNFMASRWCKEEFAEASGKQIGIVQLVWPNHNIEQTATISIPKLLKDKDFVLGKYEDKDSSKLTNKTLEEIIDTVESTRARNLAARQDNLITDFTKIAARYGKNLILQPERFLTENLTPKKRRIFIPSIGIPQSLDCNQSDELRQEIKEYDVESIHLIYDDIRIRDKWLKHLDWLNKYLDIKTLKKKNFETWLKSN